MRSLFWPGIPFAAGAFFYFESAAFVLKNIFGPEALAGLVPPSAASIFPRKGAFEEDAFLGKA